jgi:hypothetical protein
MKLVADTKMDGVHLTVWRKLTPRRFLIFWLIVVVAVKVIFLVLDSKPALFMGDSGAYLTTAYAKYIPTERSFVYGFVLRLIAYQPHSLHTVIFFQVALSALSAWIVSIILVRYFKTGFVIAALCSFLCAIEPLQLMSERFILTEAVSTFLFAALLLAIFRYLSTSQMLWLGLVQAIGAFLITIRISFLPIVLLASFVLPLLTRRTIILFRHYRFSCLYLRNWKPLIRQVVVPILFSVVVSQALLLGYKHLYGSLMVPPQRGAFLYADGLFLAGAFAPLIHPSDYPIAERRDAIFRNLEDPLEDLRKREAHRWNNGDLCGLIIKESGGDLFKANKLAKKVALRAAKRDPLGILRLAVLTFVDYFDSDYLNLATAGDEGRGQTLSAETMRNFKQHFRQDFTQLYVESLTKWWHRKCQIWYLFLLLLPLLFLIHVLIYRRQSTPYHWLCATCVLIFLEGATLMAVRPAPRFLTAMAWLGCIILGAAVTDFRNAHLRTPKMNRQEKLAHHTQLTQI